MRLSLREMREQGGKQRHRVYSSAILNPHASYADFSNRIQQLYGTLVQYTHYVR
jgi:hypothetical protein